MAKAPRTRRKRAKAGRPVSLTPQHIEAIGLLVEAGASPGAAVATMYEPKSCSRWLERGQAALTYVEEHASDLQPDEDGIRHHPDPDEDLFASFCLRVGQACASAYSSAEARLKDRTPMDWLSGPVGRTVARILDLPVYSKRPDVQVNMLTVGSVVDQAFEVLAGDGRPVPRLGPLGDLKDNPPLMLGEDNGREPRGAS